MSAQQLRAPFPYFGAKRHVGSMVWDALGDVQAYVEPFAGTASVLIARPNFTGNRREIINDLDGWVTNFWRAVRDRPEELSAAVKGPTMELDLHARNAWLREVGADVAFIDWLAGDPKHCLPEAAAWWMLTLSSSIAGGSRRGPWVRSGEGVLTHSENPREGICRTIPNIAGGITPMPKKLEQIKELHKRMESVIVTCGDWKRPVTRALDGPYNSVGVFLDPPYEDRTRTADGKTIYVKDSLEVSGEVREWCKTANPNWRIVLCGYDNEHDELNGLGWQKRIPPKTLTGGFDSKLNSRRDRLWMSPACLNSTPSLFELGGEAA